MKALRKVRVSENPNQIEANFEGFFHEWYKGTLEVFPDESMTGVFGIVEKKDGKIVLCPAESIQFLEPPTQE